MQNKAILFGSLVLVSGTAFAQSAALEGIAKQAAKDKVMSVVPGASQAAQVVEQAQQLKGVTAAPAALKDQAQGAVKDAAQQKLQQTVPAEIKPAGEAVKTGKEVTAAPVSGTAVVKDQAQEVGKDAAQQKLQPAVPTDLKQGAESVKTDKEATPVTPATVNGASAAPAVAKDLPQEAVKDAVQQKAQQAVPTEVKQGAETLKAGKESADQLKDKVDALPKTSTKAVKAAKGKAKQKVAEKALGVLQ